MKSIIYDIECVSGYVGYVKNWNKTKTNKMTGWKIKRVYNEVFIFSVNKKSNYSASLKLEEHIHSYPDYICVDE